MKSSRDFSTEHHLIQQYRPRTDYASNPDYQSSQPQLNAREATVEGVLERSGEGYAAQQKLTSAYIPSRPAANIPRLEVFDEACLLPDADFTDPLSGPGLEDGSFSSDRAPVYSVGRDGLVGRDDDLEHQLQPVQTQIQSYPSSQQKINNENEKRIVTPSLHHHHHEEQNNSETEIHNRPRLVEEEAQVEEMKVIYASYERQLRGVPKPEIVDTFFKTVGEREGQELRTQPSNLNQTKSDHEN